MQGCRTERERATSRGERKGTGTRLDARKFRARRKNANLHRPAPNPFTGAPSAHPSRTAGRSSPSPLTVRGEMSRIARRALSQLPGSAQPLRQFSTSPSLLADVDGDAQTFSPPADVAREPPVGIKQREKKKAWDEMMQKVDSRRAHRVIGQSQLPDCSRAERRAQAARQLTSGLVLCPRRTLFSSGLDPKPVHDLATPPHPPPTPDSARAHPIPSRRCRRPSRSLPLPHPPCRSPPHLRHPFLPLLHRPSPNPPRPPPRRPSRPRCRRARRPRRLCRLPQGGRTSRVGERQAAGRERVRRDQVAPREHLERKGGLWVERDPRSRGRVEEGQGEPARLQAESACSPQSDVEPACAPRGDGERDPDHWDLRHGRRPAVRHVLDSGQRRQSEGDRTYCRSVGDGWEGWA